MTIDEIMQQTGQKKGVIERFRNELAKYGLIEKHQAVDEKAFKTFKKAVEYKKNLEDNTWSSCMQRAIQEEYGEDMNLPYYFTKNIILKNLIYEVDKGIVITKQVGNPDDPNFHIVYNIIIDNFAEIGREIDAYKESYGTAGNPMTTFVCEGNGYIYYIVGKYNTITKNEDMHVFYNDHATFNIMKCTHICGGDANNGMLAELYNVCVKKIHSS